VLEFDINFVCNKEDFQMKRAFAVFTCALFLCALLPAQGPQMPQPAPEVKKLDYFIGNWTMEGDLKPSVYGPGGKFSGSERNEWMPGGFFLRSDSKMKMPMGSASGLAVMGYDSDAKRYTYHDFNSMGEAESATGTLQGDTWTWEGQQKVGGKMMNGRYTVKVISPTSYTLKYEMADEAGNYSTVMEGKGTKSQ